MDGPAAELADALASGRELDLRGAALPAALLAEVLTAPPPPGAPVLRLRRAAVNGVLRLVGAHVRVPVELHDCLFTQAPDLRMAEFSGLALTGCRVPGLRAGNLRVAADLLLNDGFTAHGPVDLTDAHVGGSLRLSAGRLMAAGGRALIADRVVVEGTCYARRLSSNGELRLPGARITGNIDLAGADITSPTGDAIDLTGIAVGGSLLAGRHGAGPDLAFAAGGRVLLAGARIGGDLTFSGARIANRSLPDPPEEAAEGSRIAGAARRDRRRRSVHRRRPGAGRGEPGARRRACTPPGRSGCPTRPSAGTCGCRVRGWTGRRAPRTGASRCSPTASRWAATWRAATTAGARSPAPGRCG